MKANYIDLVVFVFLLIEFFVGINIGAIALIFDILGIVAGFYLARLLTPSLSSFLKATFHLDDIIATGISKVLNLQPSLAGSNVSLESIKVAITSLHLPRFLEQYILSSYTGQMTNIVTFLSSSIASYILNALSFLIIFLVVLTIFRVIGIFVRKMFHTSPFLKWVDVIFGGVVRLLITFAIVSIIFHIIGVIISPLSLSNAQFMKMFLTSKTYEISEKYFYTIVSYINTLISTFK